MRYRTLGATGIEVSVYCLGAMMFGFAGNPDHDDCARIIHTALDQGINFVDTADMYSAGESEQIVGKALKGRRDDVVLASKGHFQMGEGRNRGGNSRRWIQTAPRRSSRRIGSPSGVGSRSSGPSNLRAHCSRAGSRPLCCPSAGVMRWVC